MPLAFRVADAQCFAITQREPECDPASDAHAASYCDADTGSFGQPDRVTIRNAERQCDGHGRQRAGGLHRHTGLG